MTNWVTRQQWGARPPKLTRPLSGFTAGWFIHWLGKPAAAGLPDDQVLRNTQRYHMDSKGWADIAYSFAVGRSRPDTAYELRGWGVQGGHTEGYNSQAMAIVFLLGEGERPTETQLTTAREILADGVNRGYSAKQVRPHNAVRSTACPGPDLTGWVNAGRFFAQPPKETTVPTTPASTNPYPAETAEALELLAQHAGYVGDRKWFGPDALAALHRLKNRAEGLAATNVDLAGHNVTLASERDTAIANREAAEAEALQLRRQIQEGSGRAAVQLVITGAIEGLEARLAELVKLHGPQGMA